MLSSLFIVWRESVEAMLVIGILYAWLKNNPQGEVGLRALWGGVVAGIALAGLLGWTMLAVQGELAGEALEWFQTAMLFLASLLIVQMVLWMKKHGRHMRQGLERELAQASEKLGVFGVAVVAALAVAREGAETVIFLYGMQMDDPAGSAIAFGAGVLLAGITAWIVNRGLGMLNYRNFFRVSGLLLLLFAVALLAAGTDRLIGMGALPPLVDPLWDTSLLLDDSSPSGALLSAFTGYRARPSLMLAIVYVAFWLAVLLVQRRLKRNA
ncbi:FTR1 family protein [Massilia sp. MB5]|uniref:FTR1 family iron permease n=1 Tax=Massilia sp. MB5 TaxID=2919578 RepID=UPI001F0F164E|nr:FTR1 family protein [Massilia sp. MB5]UMR32130.1 FTR1 family protein [Massilia sp. MB5]